MSNDEIAAAVNAVTKNRRTLASVKEEEAKKWKTIIADKDDIIDKLIEKLTRYEAQYDLIKKIVNQ